MTNNQISKYNKGRPIKCCCCDKTIAYQRNGEIYIKCRHCKKEMKVTVIELKPRARAIED